MHVVSSRAATKKDRREEAVGLATMSEKQLCGIVRAGGTNRSLLKIRSPAFRAAPLACEALSSIVAVSADFPARAPLPFSGSKRAFSRHIEHPL